MNWKSTSNFYLPNNDKAIYQTIKLAKKIAKKTKTDDIDLKEHKKSKFFYYLAIIAMVLIFLAFVALAITFIMLKIK
ncbi:hypothetical protein GE118_01805 [Mycoplasma sp. NEAQ87857]|uniref:hypothetical protein n=1 Tax=Mycoplasma sp. NEAQ87857 TaxID=2683967 RepID=UPI001316512E|nr:hypothetical protein [Mycoplasma sp. NEAQ87857]QGZ97530.1 hypothetical protein GE118_01805 [Mycoplasma sp. NEAQ87857]